MNLTWPPERFYWSILDVPGWKKSGPLPPAFMVEVQPDLPLDLSELHAVCAAAEDGRVIVCGAKRESLQGLAPGITSLTPASTPPELGLATPLNSALLNLLVGSFEPRAFRLRRFRHHLELVATLTLCAVFLSGGFSRRAAAIERGGVLAKQANNAHTALGSTDNSSSLEAQLSRAVRVRELVAKVNPPLDASVGLAALLGAWPTQTNATPQSLTITGSSMTFTVVTPHDPAVFLKVFAPPPGWKLEEPRMNSSGKNGSGSETHIAIELKAITEPKVAR